MIALPTHNANTTMGKSYRADAKFDKYKKNPKKSKGFKKKQTNNEDNNDWRNAIVEEE